MKYQEEIITLEFCQEMLPLLELHYEEIANFKDIPLEPDFDLYVKMYDLGFVKCFTVRDEGGSLWGYAVFVIKHNLHYKSSLQATQDVVFVHPEKRGVGARLLIFSDKELKKMGVQVVSHHVKKAHSSVFVPLLEKLGYSLVDLIYCRRL